MKKVTFIDCDNHFDLADVPFAQSIINVCGGVVANMGESQLSRFIEKNSDKLVKLLYCPVQTKGGKMLRPRYDSGNRGGSVTFPKLVELGIPADACLLRLPINWGYKAENLKTLKVLFLYDFRDKEKSEKYSKLGYEELYKEAWDKFHESPELLNSGYRLEKIQFCSIDCENPGEYKKMSEIELFTEGEH